MVNSPGQLSKSTINRELSPDRINPGKTLFKNQEDMLESPMLN